MIWLESNDISNKQLEPDTDNINKDLGFYDLDNSEKQYSDFNLNIKLGNQDTYDERFMNSLLGMGVGLGLGVGFGSAVAKKMHAGARDGERDGERDRDEEERDEYEDESGQVWIRNKEDDGWVREEDENSRNGENADRRKFQDMSNADDRGDFKIYDYNKENENRLGDRGGIYKKVIVVCFSNNE